MKRTCPAALVIGVSLAVAPGMGFPAAARDPANGFVRLNPETMDPQPAIDTPRANAARPVTCVYEPSRRSRVLTAVGGVIGVLGGSLIGEDRDTEDRLIGGGAGLAVGGTVGHLAGRALDKGRACPPDAPEPERAETGFERVPQEARVNDRLLNRHVIGAGPTGRLEEP